MISQDDIVEIVLETLEDLETREKDFWKQLEKLTAKKGKWGFYVSQPFQRSYTSLPAKKIFLSEYEIKHLLSRAPTEDKKELVIPANAIVSPLAQEWLDEKGIKIVRYGS